MSEPTQEKLEKLWQVCKTYIDMQQISCPESVYQSDGVILNAYEFIEKVCDIVGYWDCSEERNEDIPAPFEFGATTPDD